MAKPGEPKIRILPLHQMGTAVKSVDKVIENYWKMLGIGPWVYLRLYPPDVFNQTYHQKPADYKAKCALAQVGGFELEIMESLEGKTTYGDFIARHGEGPHHLQYLVEDLKTLDEHVDIMAGLGFKSEMSARTGTNGGFNYIDATSRLKAIWEPVRKPDGIHEVSARYPAEKSAISPAKLKINSISQIAIVARKLEEVMDSYLSIIGVGPWEVLELAPPVLHSTTYRGKPGDFTARVATADTGLVRLALIQPVSGDSLYSDWLKKRGEGIFSVQFSVDDIDRTTKLMNEMGFSTLMSGGISDGAFAFYDTMDALKCNWEAFQPPEGKPLLSP